MSRASPPASASLQQILQAGFFIYKLCRRPKPPCIWWGCRDTKPHCGALLNGGFSLTYALSQTVQLCVTDFSGLITNTLWQTAVGEWWGSCSIYSSNSLLMEQRLACWWTSFLSTPYLRSGEGSLGKCWKSETAIINFSSWALVIFSLQAMPKGLNFFTGKTNKQTRIQNQIVRSMCVIVYPWHWTVSQPFATVSLAMSFLFHLHQQQSPGPLVQQSLGSHSLLSCGPVAFFKVQL